MDYKFDIFLSHASEDKDNVARPLAKLLRKASLKVWYDEEVITIGDSIRRSIENGLNNSRYGLVILSKNFFAKEWPQMELDALMAKEISKGKTILPVWHKVNRDDVVKYAPILADKYAVTTDNGLLPVMINILQLLSTTRNEFLNRAKSLKENMDSIGYIKSKHIAMDWGEKTSKICPECGAVGIYEGYSDYTDQYQVIDDLCYSYCEICGFYKVSKD